MKLGKNLSTRKQFRHHGFTLLEMVMVIVIIGVLAGGVMKLMGGFGEGSKVMTVQTDMRGIESALLMYQSLAGRLPTDQQGLAALTAKPTIAPKPRLYPSTPPLKAIPVDPWGTPYIYKERGSIDNTSFELISYGADKAEGGGDDTSSQELAK